MTQQQIIEESNYLAIQFADADIDVRDAICVPRFSCIEDYYQAFKNLTEK